MTETTTPGSVFTIGHSNHTPGRFFELLGIHSVTMIVDVRSKPYSRFNPSFNRETLEAALRGQRLVYSFLGRELGGRSNDPLSYENGQVQYRKMAESLDFKTGLK